MKEPLVTVESEVTRHTPGFARLVVIPDEAVAAWNLEGTTVVEGTLNGRSIGRRTLKRWDAERWWIDLPGEWCRRAGVETGDRVELRLTLASEELPRELADLLSEDDEALRRWKGLTKSQRRQLREDVYAAKRPETRLRRARRMLCGPG